MHKTERNKLNAVLLTPQVLIDNQQAVGLADYGYRCVDSQQKISYGLPLDPGVAF